MNRTFIPFCIVVHIAPSAVVVTRQSWGSSNYIEFIYDESSQPFAMRYNGTLYYYVLNIQGDVVGLLNTSGTMVATYTYDPWGKVISSTGGTLADVNPLRYRGYYYDSETGFYYLQSRYYDPAIGRFINADTYATTDATNARSSNMFAYCENDPVNRSDPSGEIADAVVGGIIGMTTGVVSTLVAGGDISDVVIAGAIGFVTGAISRNGVVTAINVISSIYSGVKTGLACDSLGAGVAVFALSFGATLVSGKNVSSLLGESITSAAQHMTDATFGLGANLLATNIAVNMERNSKTNSVGRSETKNTVGNNASINRGQHYGAERGLSWSAPR